MKNTTILASLLAISISAIVLAGCSTTSNSVQTTALEQFAITSGVAAGTAEVISQYPTYRPDFVLAEAVLTSISTGTNTVTPAQINTLLKTQGVTNAVVAPIIVNGLTLADSYTANGTNASVQQVTSWISLGIQEGLAASTAAKRPVK